ncbi:hypothetical protein CLAIMM_06260 [Cladophialophora immunda]|nr:hypothetical protein CLAIMM_06260 [Cladophialophora immunda]
MANTNASSSQSPSSPIYLRESIDVDLGTHTLCRPESISSPETCFSDDHQQASPPKLLPPQIEEARISPSSVDFGHYLHYDMQLEIGELSNSGDLFIQDMMPELNEQPERVAMPESINQPVPLSPKTLNIQSSSASHGDGNQQEFAGDEGGRNLDVAFVRLFQSSGRSSPVGCLALDKSLEFASSLPRVGERDLREYWLSYSTTFHKIMPVIHMGSLEFDPSPSLLLSTIAAIGADSLTGDGPQGYASATYEKLFSFLAAPTDCSRAECPKCLLLLAAKCLLCYRILDHRNLLFFNAALELISHLTVEAARLGLFAVRDIDLMPQEEFSPREDTPIPRSSDANIRNTTELITTAVSQDEIPKWRKWIVVGFTNRGRPLTGSRPPVFTAYEPSLTNPRNGPENLKSLHRRLLGRPECQRMAFPFPLDACATYPAALRGNRPQHHPGRVSPEKAVGLQLGSVHFCL